MVPSFNITHRTFHLSTADKRICCWRQRTQGADNLSSAPQHHPITPSPPGLPRRLIATTMNSIAILDKVVSGRPINRSSSRAGSPSRSLTSQSSSSVPSSSSGSSLAENAISSGTASIPTLRGRLSRPSSSIPGTTPGRRSGRNQPSSRARRRRKKQRSDKGWLGGAFVAVMTLWSGLWQLLFGSEDGSRGSIKVKTEIESLSGGKVAAEEPSSDSEAVDSGAEVTDGETWPSPVTRAPDNPEDQLVGVSDVPPPKARGPAPNFTFQLRSCLNETRSAILDGNSSSRGTSILTNPTQPLPHIHIPQPQTKLLPNPLSTTLLTPHDKTPSLEHNYSSESIITTSRLATPTPTIIRSPANFHRPKTLILDLDETLIHSTSRPMNVQSHGMGGGGGLVGISLAGLFPGSTRRGGGGGRGEGHTVEVVLGGRSTLYHVYKRPFVDHFLKKVSSFVLVSQKPVLMIDSISQVSSWYTLVVFTASMQEYADPVIDWLDGGRGLFGKKLYREVSVF